MSFLDTKIFGLISSVAGVASKYTARQTIRFTGGVTVTDDPANNETLVAVEAGGATVLVGDVTGTAGASVVSSMSGASGLLKIKAASVQDESDILKGVDRTYRASLSTVSVTPTAISTHTFEFINGGITVWAQVDVCTAAGGVESHWIKQTRRTDFMGGGAPVLIGTVETSFKPTVPVNTVEFVWSTGSVSVQATSASAALTRYACKLHVFEVNQP